MTNSGNSLIVPKIPFVAVGTPVTQRPAHRSVRAGLLHTVDEQNFSFGASDQIVENLVDTSWHKVPAAVTLLERARGGEFTLHIPNVCFAEARGSIQAKCQPVEGAGIHRYIRWARQNGELTDEGAEQAHRLAEKHINDIHRELDSVPAMLNTVAGLSWVKMFALDDEMLDLANQLALTKVAQKPFDHAILAGILVTSSRLWRQGESGISFAETDSDLQPWGAKGAYKDELRKLYDDAHVWVYNDFTLQFPARRPAFK